MVAFALLSAAGAGRGAAAGLVLVAGAFYLSLRSGDRPADLFGVVPFPPRAWLKAAGGAALGLGLGAAYRWAWMPAPLPADLRPFVLVAMAIGAAEEMLYRGYVQGRVAAALTRHSAAGLRTRRAYSAWGRAGRGGSSYPPRHSREARGGCGDPPRAIISIVAASLLAAGAHTAYKTALFAFPPAGIEVDYGFLVLWTLVGGAAFGALRAWAGSVWPAVAAHVAFDLVAYGDAVRAPWWVWM